MTTAFYPQHEDIRIAEVLHLLNPPSEYELWHGGPHITTCLEGVGAAQALWVATPNTRSIWHFVLHIAYWKYCVRQRITGNPETHFPRAPENFPDPPKRPDVSQWESDKALLSSENDLLIQAICQLDSEALDRSFPGGSRLLDQIMGIAMHDAYHIAQIQLLKRQFEDRVPTN